MIPAGLAALILTFHTITAIFIIWDNNKQFPYKHTALLVIEYVLLVLVMYITQNL